ncbi:hypothetical protein FHS42_003092 [Streptomyces zagrosensis]|uniref:Uncharacterized protein n=1 Tax=Streptomyces zagrosensis TaxID=1042984 RepID=A0A7W9Q9A8_9ACTN|nr:hypothetical protein [Streptomyces zagrosensis]
MLSLRLALGAGPATQVRRSLVAAAAAGAGFLLLCALGYALAHPYEKSACLARLLWCVAPLAATVQLAVAVNRTESVFCPAPGLSAAGCGSFGRAVLAAASTALVCGVGSALALLAFLFLRGSVLGSPLNAPTLDALAVGHRLPVGAVLTLLAVVPTSAAMAIALSQRTPTAAGRCHTRPLQGEPQPPSEDAPGPVPIAPIALYASQGSSPIPAGTAPPHSAIRATTAGSGAAVSSPPPTTAPLAEPTVVPRSPSTYVAPRAMPPVATTETSRLVWGTALLLAGLALTAYASRDAADIHDLIPVPGHLTGAAAAVSAAWLLAALGLVLVGPALIRGCGSLLAMGRPGAVRLLAGRALQEEAGRLGRPLGALCAVASTTYVAVRLCNAVPNLTVERLLGPLTGLGVALVMGCITATALITALETTNARADSTNALLCLGAPRSLRRQADTLRGATVFTALAVLTWIVAELVTMPLTC